jgi:hypothetical protein
MDRHRVSRAVIPGSDDSAYAEQIARMLENRGIELVRITEGDVYQVASGSDVTVESIPEDGNEPAARPLLLTTISYGDTVLLLANGVGADNPVCTVLQRNAGSNVILVIDETGTLLEQFRKKAGASPPSLVVLSAHTPYARDSLPRAAREEADGLCTLMWTRWCGAVTIDMHGEGFKVRSMLSCGP